MLIEEFQKDTYKLTCNLGQYFSRLSAMPGRKRWIDRTLAFQPSGVNVRYILDQFPEAEWSGSTGVIRDKYIMLKQQEQNVREDKKAELTQCTDYEFKTVPFDHQLRAFMLSRDLETFALFHEQGTGKTKVIIDTTAYLFERGLIDRLIILAKNGVHHNWILNELPAHLPDRIERTLAYYVAGKKRNVAPKTRPGKLHCMAFAIEGFSSEMARDLLVDWLDSGKCMLVIDESSTIKNPSAKRTKFLVTVAPKATYRRIMTGTPITRGQENLYSQFKFLDPNILGHSSFTTFRAEYCIMGGFENRAIVGYKKTEELIQIVDGSSDRVLKKDCLDLPPKVYKRIPFDLSPEHRKFYDVYRRGVVEELQALLGEDDGLKRAQELAITKALRLQQIACGLNPDSEMARLPGTNARMNVLMGAMEDFDDKTIVWVRFKTDMKEILAAWGKQAVGYFGGIKEDDRIVSLRRFVQDDKVKYLIASASAAYGHSLPAVGAIYHSQSSSLDIRLQSEDRCHGINRTIGPTATYVDIEGIRTVDGKIIKALRAHKAIADLVLQDPVSLFMEDEEDARESVQ